TNSVTNNGQIRWIAGGTNTQAATSVFGGAGAMHIAGAGTTVLLGTNTFSGGTTIDTPGRVVAGSSAAFGTGPLTILNGSFELPDGSPSTITLGGFNQSGGSLSLHLGGTTPGTFTNLLVDGNTTLTGGTVFLENTTGTYIPRAGDLQNIISTTPGNTLTGQFVSNLPDSSFFNPVLGQTINYGLGNTLLYPTITYDANNADILWVQDSFVVSPALTPNQNSVANALDNSNGPLIDLLVLAPIGDLPAIYDLIAPDEMNAMFQMGINAAEIQNTNITRHLQQARQSAATTGETTYGPDTTDAKGGMVTRGSPITGDSNRWSVFLEGTHGSASRDATFGAAGYDLDSEGVTLGADMRVSDRFVFGILGAYDDRSANLSNGGDIEATGYRGAVFATWFQNNFFVDGLLGAGTTSYDTSRAAVAGFAEGETDGTEFSAMLNTGYNIRQGAWTITPTASLAYTRVDIDGFTETGSLSPLRYPDQDQDSLRSELGVNLAYTIPVGSVTVTPQIRLAWQHEFMDTDSISSGLAGANNGPLFNTSGARTDRDRALFGVGVNVGITRNFSIYGYYDGQLGSSDNDYNTTTLGLKYDF
ncbi:MAG: autotransporter outer membrane beta-barrel domain-containing protein, partial [Verrucomicrobiaceae bacterium]